MSTVDQMTLCNVKGLGCSDKRIENSPHSAVPPQLNECFSVLFHCLVFMAHEFTV